MKEDNKIGTHIRAERKKAGLTQAQLAEKANMSTITLRRFETGASTPRPNQLAAISSALNDCKPFEEQIQTQARIIFDSIQLQEEKRLSELKDAARGVNAFTQTKIIQFLKDAHKVPGIGKDPSEFQANPVMPDTTD